MSITAEQVKARKKWAKALRSGKYEQTTGRLTRDGKYCCLGVACDISGLGEWNDFFSLSDTAVYLAKSGEVAGCSLPYIVIAKLGLGRDDEAAFIRRNDTSGDDFATIADTIELITLADMED